MNDNSQCVPLDRNIPTIELPIKINRNRYIELTVLANETCSFLESRGLKKGEQCTFRRIAEELWFAG